MASKIIPKYIPFQKEFEGILNYFQKYSNINEEINITHSPDLSGKPDTLYNFENKSNIFNLQNHLEQWICFEFKKHNIILTNYTIRSYISGRYHPKSWIIEGSNDLNVWDQIDEQKNCLFMKGRTYYNNIHVHTFAIQNKDKKSFKYIRLTQTDENWGGDHDFVINCIEFYGFIK